MAPICDFIASAFDESADWVDERFISEDGKLQGYVIHRGSVDYYGHFKNADNNGAIRFKLTLLALTVIPRAAWAALFRSCHLISGYWIWGQGVPEALVDWKQETGIYELCKKAAVCSLKHFAWASLTFLTYPLNLALGVGCFFVSIPRPLLGRRLFGQLEEAWGLPVYSPSFFTSLLNFHAPCMQPKRIWEIYNLYKMNPCDQISSLFKTLIPQDLVHENA